MIKMRIAFVSDSVYPWNFGGIETIENSEARELAKKHEVHFFSMKWPGMKENFRYNGVRYHASHDVTVKKFYRHGRRSIREALIFGFRIFAIFNYKFDVIQANEFPIIHLPVIWLYCKLNNCKLILDVHEVWDRSYWTSYLGNVWGSLASAYASWVIMLGDAYIANSSTTASQLQAIGVEKKRINIFSPVLDTELIEKVKLERGSNGIIFWGRLIKEKRLDKFLEIVKVVSKKVRNLNALILGDGPEKGNIQKMIDKMSLGSTVKLEGFQKDRIKLFGRVKSSGLLLHMSEREGLSTIILESLTLGTPVVIPDYSPVPSEVKEMCVVEKERDMPNKIVEILNSRNKRAYIRNRGNLTAFSISNVNQFYKGLFKKIENW